MKRWSLACLFFLGFFFFSFQPVGAITEIETKYDFRYQVYEDGLTNVRQTISLTNKVSAVYASQYSFTLPTLAIKNITASDENGPCRTEVNQKNNSTVVDIYFNQEVVGSNKTLTFNLTFDSLDIAHKDGEIWEIIIPRIANLGQKDDYQLLLVIPASFGNPAFIRPSPIEESQEGNFNSYRFVKSQNIAGGVMATFGLFQVFDFTLFYHLQNPNFSLGETEIALPPDTAFQQIAFQKIEPAPINIRIDQDGNWLAKYHLKSREKIDIVATGQAKIFTQPQQNFPQPVALENYLLKAPFWEVDDPQIKKIATDLKTPKAIYDFVVKTLDYSFERVSQSPKRFGALQSLAKPNEAICMEFADLFVALCRAAGIPARTVDGFAYTDDSRLRPLSLMIDVLHVWPEYYSEQKRAWIPVDPTWGKTTGGIDYFSQTDLRHLAFAIHGQDSQTPYPAGSYKLPESLGKDVQVVFGEYLREMAPNLKLTFDLPQSIFWGESQKGKVLIRNEGQTAGYQIQVKISAQGLKLISDSESIIKIIPPFSSVEIPIELATQSFLTNGQGQIKVWLNDQDFSQKIEIGSFLKQLAFPLIGTALSLITLLTVIKQKL